VRGKADAAFSGLFWRRRLVSPFECLCCLLIAAPQAIGRGIGLLLELIFRSIVAQAQLNRIHLQRPGELVHRRFEGEARLGMAGGAERHRRARVALRGDLLGAYVRAAVKRQVRADDVAFFAAWLIGAGLHQCLH
jgi:hypothetical protein